jgi:hypothetical protein
MPGALGALRLSSCFASCAWPIGSSLAGLFLSLGPATLMDALVYGIRCRPLTRRLLPLLFLESTFKDQISPSRHWQTAFPHWGPPELDLALLLLILRLQIG